MELETRHTDEAALTDVALQSVLPVHTPWGVFPITTTFAYRPLRTPADRLAPETTMPRTRKDAIEFANFVCKFGSYDLLDYADEIVLPALTSDERRKYGRTTYFFLRPKVAEIDGTLAFIFEFVKDTRLESDQVFDGTDLVPRHEHLDSAPSALGVLLLDTHRLVYYPKTRFAPTLRELAITSETFIRRQHSRYIASLIDLDAGNTGQQRVDLLKRIQPPVVHITPLSSAASVTDALRRFRRIRKIEMRLIDTNNEVDFRDFFKTLRAQQHDLQAATSAVTHSGPGKDGINPAGAARTVHGATEQGTVQVTVVGEGKDGETLKQSNDEVSVRVFQSVLQKTPRGAAPYLKKALATLVDKKVLHAPGVVSEKVKRKLDELKKKWL